MTTLADYEFQVLDLLHDPQNTKWSLQQIDRYINEARRALVRDTGCLRSLQQSYLTQGVEQYTFGQVAGAVVLTPGSGYTFPAVSFSGGGGSGVAASLAQTGGAVNTITFSNFGSGYTSAPTATVSDGGPGTGATIGVGVVNVNTFDILGIHLYFGTQRYSLDWMPFSRFSARLRLWTAQSYQRQCAAWAIYGENTFFVGPPPDQSYQIEIDSIVLPTTLADYTTTDPIPIVYQDPIKFYAAHLAKFNDESYGESEQFLNQYNTKVREWVASYTRRIPSQYKQS